ncbi:MAG: molybdenum cofactor biosynthesis protein [Thermoplasmatota archaeon]
MRLFAGPREAVGAREVSLVLPHGATLGDARDALEARYPTLAKWRDVATFARNREPAAANVRLADGDELALLPPVSGGAGARKKPKSRVRSGARGLRAKATGSGKSHLSSSLRRPAEIPRAPEAQGQTRIQRAGETFQLDATLASLAQDGAGAVVFFLGLVRPPATRLEFDAYEEMANVELARVRDAAVAKFALVDARILHRVGTLATSEPIVLVAVSAPHRAEAFEAAQWIMDELKTVVPIWKKEVTPAGEHWVNDPR